MVLHNHHSLINQIKAWCSLILHNIVNCLATILIHLRLTGKLFQRGRGLFQAGGLLIGAFSQRLAAGRNLVRGRSHLISTFFQAFHNSVDWLDYSAKNKNQNSQKQNKSNCTNKNSISNYLFWSLHDTFHRYSYIKCPWSFGLCNLKRNVLNKNL